MPALPLVPRQPPVAPLDRDAQHALTELRKQRKKTQRLVHHLTQAADQLESVAGQLNDRGVNHSSEHRKKRRRAEANDEEVDPQEKAQYEDFQTKVQDYTRKMDHGIRAVIDDQTWVQSLPDAIKQITEKVKASAAASQGQTQHTDGEDETESANASAYPPPPPADDVPSALIKTAREDLTASWSSKTLTERYSQNNTYVGFYRMVHDARNPGEDLPPIPDHSLWFANEEDAINPSYVPPGTQQASRPRRRNSSNTAAAADDDADSSDIEIAREKISIKCPITFLPFTDPLTSTKCPHSFDRAGIMDMLQRSAKKIELTDADRAELAQIANARERGQRAREIQQATIQCPVCTITLTEADLKPDPVLLRKVKRVVEREEREREEVETSSGPEQDRGDGDDDDDDDEDEDGDDVVGMGRAARRKRGVGPSGQNGGEEREKEKEKEKKRASNIKKERARSKSRAVSRVPATQLGGDGEDLSDH